MHHLKFRCWDGSRFHYWGYDINPEFPMGVFTAPPNPCWPSFQYIGMKDKNGNEIYEADICEIKTQSGKVENFIVKWGIHRRHMASGWTVDIPGFCFFIDGVASFPIVQNYNNGHDLELISIIGNSCENHELFQSL